MNRKIFLAATVGLLAFTSCSAQQRQMIHNARPNDKPSESVLSEGLTSVADDAAIGACAIDNGACSPTPESLGPPFVCQDGADNAACTPAPVSDPNAPPPPVRENEAP
jgi:hypothetical protein